MSNSVPYEVIAASPIAIFLAPVGTAFPTLDDAEVDFDPLWVKLGISGELSYDDGAGVVVEHSQSVTKWRALGDAGSRKVFRGDEDCTVKVKVIDLTLETYGLILNQEVTTVAAGAGTVGYKRIGLSRGLGVQTYAVLIRLLMSPYGAEWIGQYEFPVSAMVGSPSVAFMKTTPAGLEVEFNTLVDPDASTPEERFGRLLFQDADASS